MKSSPTTAWAWRHSSPITSSSRSFRRCCSCVALISFIPIEDLLEAITTTLARVAPGEVLSLIQEQIIKIAQDKDGGLLTLGMIGTIWSTSAGMTAIIDTLNQAYDIHEGRPWWKVRLRRHRPDRGAGRVHRRIDRARRGRARACRQGRGLVPSRDQRSRGRGESFSGRWSSGS